MSIPASHFFSNLLGLHHLAISLAIGAAKERSTLAGRFFLLRGNVDWDQPVSAPLSICGETRGSATGAQRGRNPPPRRG
jgi:hypothetical protein